MTLRNIYVPLVMGCYGFVGDPYFSNASSFSNKDNFGVSPHIPHVWTAGGPTGIKMPSWVHIDVLETFLRYYEIVFLENIIEIFFFSFEIFLRYTWDLRFKLCCGIMGIIGINETTKPVLPCDHFYIVCFFLGWIQNSHVVFCKLPWDTTDSFGNVSTFSKCWSHRLYVHRRHFGCCVQAKPRSLSHLWNLHLHHTKLPNLVMTNSSPWYRWPIRIDSLPFLKMVDLSMANC